MVPLGGIPSSHLQDNREHDLVALIREGNAAAFADLFHRHAEAMAELAFHYVRDEGTAQDVVQDVFIKLWDRRTSWGVQGSVRGYLFRAVRNRALNVLEHERIERRVQDTSGLASSRAVAGNDGETNIAEREFAAALNRALAELPPRCREIFLLHRDEGLTYQEIAETLEIGIPTIHNQMSRAMKALSATLRKMGM